MRHTDVQALLVNALVHQRQYAEALTALRELAFRATDWSSRGLVERKLVERLAEECRVDFTSVWESGRRAPVDATGSDGGDGDGTVEEHIFEGPE